MAQPDELQALVSETLEELVASGHHHIDFGGLLREAKRLVRSRGNYTEPEIALAFRWVAASRRVASK
jgi:hypothetical protein